MEYVTPEYIADLVNFYSEPDKPEWRYDSAKNDMRTLQARGAAKIFNILKEHRIALLADEVGMGKTIQSLAVCAALWNQNPDARILVFAPREVVALNWLNEYENFIRTHYRFSDDIVKSASGHDPVKKPFFCTNLFALADGIRQGWPRFFVAKTTSLSSLMAGDLAEERLQLLGINNTKKLERIGKKANAANAIVAGLIKESILEAAESNTPYFDLLIVDEAHYFRNVKAASLRQETARILFGNPGPKNSNNPIDLKLAKNVLLLTATPNHSSSKDIGNILGQFQSGMSEMNHETLLETLCVRRLRKLGKDDAAKIKYNYRKEILRESDFANEPLSEMFFGIYQHELVKMMRSEEGHSASGSRVNQIMKYLEGVEFIPTCRPERPTDTDEESRANKGNDFDEGSDAELLFNLSKNFNDIFGQHPSHPKYNRIVEDLDSLRDQEKTLVFVRRIASVTQIAEQALRQQDRKLWARLQAGSLQGISYERLDRKRFSEALKHTVLPEEDEPAEVAESTEATNIPESKVLDLFKIKKRDRNRSTPAAAFRNNFAASRTGVMALFFSPGADYHLEPYRDLELLRFNSGSEVKANYFNSALKVRIGALRNDDLNDAKDILSILMPRKEEAGKNTRVEGELPTFFTVFWEVLRDDNSIPEAYKQKLKSTYDTFTIHEREAFSKFINKGALLASSSVVEFFRISLEIEGDGVPHYRKFTAAVRERLRSLRLYKQVQESILEFKTLYTKEFAITSPEKLLEEEWSNFDNAQPIYPYSRGNSNQKILKSFNTPFFPDVLIATSVLQEGVNLQYFCDSVYHYGMAWTPGDNEQRIGRIDRMFSKIDRRLQSGEKATLDIAYPYLKSTIDEEQLRRFIKRKFHEENLIDRGLSNEGSEHDRLDDSDNDDWKSFLREPIDAVISDPFPALHTDFSKIRKTRPVVNKKDLSGFFPSIAQSIASLDEFRPKSYSIRMEGYEKLLVDPEMAGGRNQPVIIELVLDPIGSGYSSQESAVYCLRMRTPICPLTEFRKLRDAFYDKTIQDAYSYGLKLCLNPALTGGSYWACHMAAELPFFITNPEENLLNEEEIKTAFRRLILCADLIEQQVFGRDISKEELRISVEQTLGREGRKFRSSSRSAASSWDTDGDYYFLRKAARDDFNNNDKLKAALILNNLNLYIKTAYVNKAWTHEVSYLRKDAQSDELALMEKHLEVFMQRVEWEK